MVNGKDDKKKIRRQLDFSALCMLYSFNNLIVIFKILLKLVGQSNIHCVSNMKVNVSFKIYSWNFNQISRTMAYCRQNEFKR